MKRRILCITLLLVLIMGTIPVSAKKKTPKINKTELVLTVNETAKLKISNATKRYVDWASTDKRIATVNASSGKVKAVKQGECYIYGFYQNTMYECKVTVVSTKETDTPTIHMEFPVGFESQSTNEEIAAGYWELSYYDADFTMKNFQIILHNGILTDEEFNALNPLLNGTTSVKNYKTAFNTIFTMLKINADFADTPFALLNNNTDTNVVLCTFRDDKSKAYYSVIIQLLPNNLFQMCYIIAEDGSKPTDKINTMVQKTLQEAYLNE